MQNIENKCTPHSQSHHSGNPTLGVVHLHMYGYIIRLLLDVILSLALT